MLTSPPDALTHADVAAYWNRPSRQGRRRSHWREAMPGEWEQIGRSHGEMLRELWPEVDKLVEPDAKWVEWGCGGGANVAMLSEIASEVYGVDVCDANLDECDRIMSSFNGRFFDARSYRRFFRVLIAPGNPESVTDVLRCLDGFLSTSTFQHFPSKEYTERIVQLIPQLVRPGGYVFVQIRRDSPENPAVDAGLPYEKRAIYATVYDVDEFGDLLAAHGVDVEKVENIDRGQYSYFFGRLSDDHAVPVTTGDTEKEE